VSVSPFARFEEGIENMQRHDLASCVMYSSHIVYAKHDVKRKIEKSPVPIVNGVVQLFKNVILVLKHLKL
jgi:hypothetical protein